jgi:hypothetical protein
MKFLAEFDRFLEETVNLSPGRLSALEGRVATIEGLLKASTNPDLVVVEARPQGSLAQRTIINPIDSSRGFDADLLVEFEEHGLGPKELLKSVKDLLKASPRHGHLVRARTRCVMLEYAGEFHLDVVPCVKQGPIPYIANRVTDEWEPTDPVGFTAWMQDHDERAGHNLVPSIRLCKYLRDAKGRPRIKSVILTVLLAQMVDRRAPTEYVDLPTTLVLLLEDLASWSSAFTSAPLLREPTCQAELRLDETNWAAFTAQIESLARRAREALDEEGEDRSLALWRELFGSRFPSPEKALRKSASQLEEGEEDLYRHLGIPSDLHGTVSIAARVRPKEGHMAGTVAGLSPLEKDRQLEFTVASTSISPPFDVYWKVKNSGPVARSLGQLRGEITRDDNVGYPRKIERTAYTGPHYVEVYIVQGGVCVALARENVDIA